MGRSVRIKGNSEFPILFHGLVVGSADWEQMLLTASVIDIIQFTGLSYLLAALLRKCRIPDLLWLPIGILLYFFGRYLQNNVAADTLLSKIALSPFIYSNETAFFPLLNCFAYVAAGNLIGELIRKTNDRVRLF